MSFSSDVKQEVAQKIMNGSDQRAEMSALIKMTSSLSLSNRGMTIFVSVENAAVARTIYRTMKERYQCEIDLSIKKKMNLKKNNVYRLRIVGSAMSILEDLGIFSDNGPLDRPPARMVNSESNARAYLAGAFLASGSINPPEKTSYHLEITAASAKHAQFLVDLMERFRISAKVIERRNKQIVYVKSAEKIADFLRIIEADEALLEFENIRISRDFTNSITRLNNIDLANEVKVQNAAARQLEDIAMIEEDHKYNTLDAKLRDVVDLRKENPESSLAELALLYEQKTGVSVSKSGLKHRFQKIHEIAVRGHEDQ